MKMDAEKLFFSVMFGLFATVGAILLILIVCVFYQAIGAMPIILFGTFVTLFAILFYRTLDDSDL